MIFIKKIKILIFLLLLIFIPLGLLQLADNYFSERTNTYVYQVVKKITSDFFYQTIQSIDQKNTLDLVNYQYDNNKQITSILINNQIVNNYIVLASKTISEKLAENEYQNKLKEIAFPLGQLLSPALFASVGPDIHINTIIIDSYQVDIATSINEYGINNAIFEIYLKLNITLQLMIPLKHDQYQIESQVCLLSQMIQGSVPRYFYQGSGDVLYIPED